jgi:microcystin-dependent protein
MADQFVGEIRAVGFNFPPSGWAFCDGQLMPISQNTALFSLLGTFYGGDGKSTFALPNLQGNVALAQGQGPGLSARFMGEEGGSQNVTLLQTEMPAHIHNFQGSSSAAQTIPTANGIGQNAALHIYKTGTPTTVQMAANMVGPQGGSQPHNNMMPFLCLNFVIALQGIFPQRA